MHNAQHDIVENNKSHSLQLQVERVLSIYADVWTPVVYFYGINRIEISMALDNLQLY